MLPISKPRLLTGDTPTGSLHLGHWVGSLENRINLIDQYDCYFIIANTHAFTTKTHDPQKIHDDTLEIMLDYLSIGLDPNQCTIFVQSDIPAIFELTFMLSMLVSMPRLLRNPTIKDEIRDKKLGNHYSFGFLLYPIGQVADILCFRPDVIPVGEDQIPHIELTREVARSFNQIYCHVPAGTVDTKAINAGGLFPIPQYLLGSNKRLIGISAPNEHGQFVKMSKSLDNAILLKDSADKIARQIMKMYTDPNRKSSKDEGQVENNPLWIYHDTFNPDKAWVEEAKDKYRHGQIGDVECKKKLIDVIVALTAPFRQRRAFYENDKAFVIECLRQGAEKANAVAQETLTRAKEYMCQLY